MRSRRIRESSPGTSGTSPTNMNGCAYGKVELPNKKDVVLELLPKVFEWARSRSHRSRSPAGYGKGIWSAPEKIDRHRPRAVRAVGCSFIPQLQLAGRFRAAREVARTISPPDYLHRIHGALGGKHLRQNFADRKTAPCGGDQLGIRRRQIANLFPVGFMGETLRVAAAAGLVPRYFSSRRHSIS